MSSPRAATATATGQALELRFRPAVSSFITKAVTGQAREVAAFGTRGDGKTWGAFGAMIEHAQRHHAAGGELPTKWLGAADTFQSHKSKTHESLTAPGWASCWRLKDDGHLAVFRVGGVDLVHLRLFGVEDQSGMDRLRAECHGLWFEEPAPSSVLVQSSGLSESAWSLGLTSQRLGSYCHPAIMTLNYPDEDHWTWQRFVVRAHPGTAYVRIPPGERASAAQREEWARALAGRPDMLRRLLEGQPGVLQLGEQVASGFNADDHVLYGQAPAVSRESALWLGTDGGESHTWVTVVGQRITSQGRQRLRIHAALLSSPSGARQHMKDTVLPWLSEAAPWALNDGERRPETRYDPACDTEDPGDAESNPLRTMRAILPGTYRPGAVSWAGRRDPLLALLRSRDPMLEVVAAGAGCRGLIRALSGGWHYPTGPTGAVTRDKPKKPNHPHEDYGDALCYLVAGVAPLAAEIRVQPAGFARLSPNAWDNEGIAAGGLSPW